MPLPPRSTQFLGIRQVAGWRLKLYGIAVHDRLPRPSLVSAALEQAAAVVPSREAGCGFVIAHDARPGCFVPADWWRGVDLHQRYFQSPLDDPAAIVERTEPNAVGCVWELAVVAHEAAARARHSDERDAYLADVFSVACQLRPDEQPHRPRHPPDMAARPGDRSLELLPAIRAGTSRALPPTPKSGR
jgi:hypothetical protein